jgi:DinB superfamily
MTTDIRYPTGRFARPEQVTTEQRAQAIATIASTPAMLRAAVKGLNEQQLDTPYRPEGWTVRQVVHHLPDSHLNAYVRVKLALTEDKPTVKPYFESRWAELPDSRTTPAEVSLTMMDVLHDRWVRVLQGMQAADFAREIIHPEHGPMSLDVLLAMYAWHGPHHVAQITELRRARGW